MANRTFFLSFAFIVIFATGCGPDRLPYDDSTNDVATSESDETSVTDETGPTSDLPPTPPPTLFCWQSADATWCTADLGDQLLPVECEEAQGQISIVWPFGCAAGQPVDFTKWDGGECTSTGCVGILSGMRVQVLPQCVADAIDGANSDVWPETSCTAGEPLPPGWDELRCSGSCLARLGSLWTTPLPKCASAEWEPCRAQPAQPDCTGTLGCECIDGVSCVAGLVCKEGFCGPCPDGNPGCPCRSSTGACDLDLVCVAGVCEWP